MILPGSDRVSALPAKAGVTPVSSRSGGPRPRRRVRGPCLPDDPLERDRRRHIQPAGRFELPQRALDVDALDRDHLQFSE
ncbi:hypothetical protein chiPu_0027809, partial [Chiloscyllium punctatum]|nr:hypothetical protein [Chiloscyllium punctatum]